MALVYLASDPNFRDRPVVVKIIKRAFSDDDSFRERFRREAETVALLDHPAIVPVYDFDEQDGQPYLVMRYMAGGSLVSRIQQGLNLSQIAAIVGRVASALDEAHEHGIIHRDLKPANILFDAKGIAYLADFGIAKKVADDTRAFATQGFLGTPEYASPEQAAGQVQIDGRSDVYALGAIVFEMLTGKLPYTAESWMGVLWAHVQSPVPDVLALNPELPEICRGFIYKALAKDRDERYRTASELSQVLTTIATQVPTKPGQTQTHISRPTITPFEPVTVTEGVSEAVTRIERPPTRKLITVVLISLVALTIVLVGGILSPIFFAQSLSPTRAVANVTEAELFTAAVTFTETMPIATQATVGAATIQPGGGLIIVPTLDPRITYTPIATQISQSDKAVMVLVPEGEFAMGSATSDSSDTEHEMPQHVVYLDSYWIDQTEVTNEMYAAFLNSIASETSPNGPLLEWQGLPIFLRRCPDCSLNGRIIEDDGQFTLLEPYASHPVIFVTWYGANAYCQAMGRRLPTEAEWEKAARGVDGRLYPWGNESPDFRRLNFNSNEADTMPVGSFPTGASPYGVLDMAGNVGEFVSDWYSRDYYAQSPLANPLGPEAGEIRLFRGGSWAHPSSNEVRSAYRFSVFPEQAGVTVGFRCAQLS
jgi:eukaryotic-like serine/threonine-protein kinase